MDTINLYEYALARTRESAGRRELVKVADESGLDYSWLCKFTRGTIPGASYEKVDQLARYYMRVVPAGDGANVTEPTLPVALPNLGAPRESLG